MYPSRCAPTLSALLFFSAQATFTAKTNTEPHTTPWGQLAPTVQVAHEAFQDGLFTAEELEHTVGELRSEYEAALEALGVDAASLPDPSTDKPPPPRPASRADTYRGVRALTTSLPHPVPGTAEVRCFGQWFYPSSDLRSLFGIHHRARVSNGQAAAAGRAPAAGGVPLERQRAGRAMAVLEHQGACGRSGGRVRPSSISRRLSRGCRATRCGVTSHRQVCVCPRSPCVSMGAFSHALLRRVGARIETKS